MAAARPACCSLCLGPLPADLQPPASSPGAAAATLLCADCRSVDGPAPTPAPAPPQKNIVHAAPAARACMVCGGPAAIWCSGCGAVAYCMASCAERDGGDDHGRWLCAFFRRSMAEAARFEVGGGLAASVAAPNEHEVVSGWRRPADAEGQQQQQALGAAGLAGPLWRLWVASPAEAGWAVAPFGAAPAPPTQDTSHYRRPTVTLTGAPCCALLSVHAGDCAAPELDSGALAPNLHGRGRGDGGSKEQARAEMAAAWGLPVGGGWFPAAGQPDRPPPGGGGRPLAGWAEYLDWRGLRRDSPAPMLLTFGLTLFHTLQTTGLAAAAAGRWSRRASAAGGGDGGGDTAWQPIVVHLPG